ncbi:SDR family NAD(P)-dependent oxidoreductase [Roseiflexus castenholzii]|jgi:short-subunit dehydrogenase|uniref:Short-chain dehydrogenase/reductase SDR n=1 Tax=Roseiflexus castenholzii (strain DSM 13941 / HLO8) TaxID=383372 RepID=A7NIF3_ROSCS|nr:SDR family NAD(P)-dependent oxidoreductase [Roseiflexus castenholzii]ABU57253.1 short-chain dehydrogenase/reductase SDR [Roseiflexus castenholzii DSM 13941]
MRNIQKTIVLITGASYGIGAATARAFGRRGAHVLLLARTQSALEDVARDIRASGGAASVYPVDLTDARAVEEVAQQVLAAFGPPDILLSNAGAGRWLFIDETTPDEAVAMMAMPYFAAFSITRAFLPSMRARGRGHLAYVNSPASLVAWPGAAAYTAARWALRGFVEALRAELHGTRLRVTTIIPGLVATTYFEHNPGVLERVPGLARRLLPVLTADQAAAAIVRGIEHGRREIVLPGMLRLLYAAYAIAPGLVQYLTILTGARHDRRP